MKKQLFYAACIAMSAASCTDSMDEVFPVADREMATRAVTAETSPYFNWEDTASISLVNINGSVLLPWYSGAVANIPSFILSDFKAEDGWQMVYNTCSPSSGTQEDKYYLMFYNIFSGKLRCFVYNNHDVTSGENTYWQFTFNNGTALLNDIDNITLPADEDSGNREMLVSNLTNTPTKALTRGWNSFEADFLTYDPTLAGKNIAMSISAYDVKCDDIKVAGNIDLRSEGTMVTSTNVNTLKTPSSLNKGVNLLADKAERKFESLLAGNKKTRGLLSSTVGSIIKAGGNFLVKKFFGRNSTSTTTSMSDIKIQTTGDVKLSGTVTSQQQSNVAPISQLMVPGSTPTPQDVFLPSYNEPLGVWSLTSKPVVTATSYDWMYIIMDKSGELNSLGISMPATVIGDMGIRTVYELTSCPVQINPAIRPYLDSYMVLTRLVYVKEGLDRKLNQSRMVPNSNSETFEEMASDYEYYSSQDSLYMLYSNELGQRPMIVVQDLDYMYVEKPWKEAQKYFISGVKRDRVSLMGDIKDFYVKVSVTLYPKAPYNTTPIVTTRTFKPKIVEGN